MPIHCKQSAYVHLMERLDCECVADLVATLFSSYVDTMSKSVTKFGQDVQNRVRFLPLLQCLPCASFALFVFQLHMSFAEALFSHDLLQASPYTSKVTPYITPYAKQASPYVKPAFLVMVALAIPAIALFLGVIALVTAPVRPPLAQHLKFPSGLSIRVRYCVDLLCVDRSGSPSLSSPRSCGFLSRSLSESFLLLRSSLLPLSLPCVTSPSTPRARSLLRMCGPRSLRRP